MLSIYEFRLLILLCIIAFFFEIVYITNSPKINLLNIFFMIVINVIIFVIIWYEIPKMDYSKPKGDFVGFGSSMNDAIYGRKYRYDLIVDTDEKKMKENK